MERRVAIKQRHNHGRDFCHFSKNSDMHLTQTSSLADLYVSHECPPESIHSRGAQTTQGDLATLCPGPPQSLYSGSMSGIATIAGIELNGHLSTRQIQIVHPLPPAPKANAIIWQVDVFRLRYISWILVCLPCLQSPDNHHYPVAHSVLFTIMGFPIITPRTRDTLKSKRGMTKRTT